MAHSSLDTLVAKVSINQPPSMLNAPTRKLSHADTWLADCIQKGSMSPLYLAKFIQKKKISECQFTFALDTINCQKISLNY